MNPKILKKIDQLLGRIVLPPVSVIPLRKGRRLSLSVLIIRPGGIGDAVLLLPAIRAIKNKYRDAIITVLAEKRNCAAFELCTEVDVILTYDRSRDFLATFRTMYDVVIDTEQWHRLSAVVAHLTRSPMLVGFATNERSKLFTHHVRYSHDDYEVDSFFNLIVPLGINPKSDLQTPYLTVPRSSMHKADVLLGDFAAGAFVTIFPGASIPERRWGVQKFIGLAEMLKSKGIPFVVIGGREDRLDGDRIAARGSGLNLAGQTSLLDTAALIDLSSLLVSGDSGILHIAVGLGKPTVSLFGPGIAKKWAPRGDSHFVINKCLPCSPCTRFGTTPRCRISAQCMTDISVDEVAAAVEKQWSESASKSG